MNYIYHSYSVGKIDNETYSRRKGVTKMQNEWISVKDRLPKLDTPVIVATDCGKVFEAVRIRRCRKHYWTNAVWKYEPMEIHTSKVCYWQPLPQPPKGE